MRPSTPADAPAIVALLRDALAWDEHGPLADPRQLHWKYWCERPDWSGPRSFVLARGADILAHAGIVPGICISKGQRLRTIHMVDWAARPGSVGAGIVLLKHIGRLSDALVAVGGSEQTTAILPALGFRPHGVATRFARPLRPLLRLVHGADHDWTMVPRVARNLLWTLSATPPHGCELEVRRIVADEMESALPPLPRPGPDMAVFERSAAQLSHAIAYPMAPTALYAVTRKGRACGYFLLTFVPAQARLIDCWVDSDDPAQWRSLIELAVAQAKEGADVAEIVTLASDSMLSQCLVDCGFHARSERPIQLLAMNGHNVSETTLRVQLLENDSAFIDDGFWT